MTLFLKSIFVIFLYASLINALSSGVIEEAGAQLTMNSVVSRASTTNGVESNYCSSEGEWPRTKQDNIATLPCGDSQYYYGVRSRSCIKGKPATWGEEENGCHLYTCDETVDNGHIFNKIQVNSYITIEDQEENKYYVKYCDDKHTWSGTEAFSMDHACLAKTQNGLFWPVTEKGFNRFVSCGIGKSGYAERHCGNNGWEEMTSNSCSIASSHVSITIPNDASYYSNIPIYITCSLVECKINENKLQLSNGATLKYDYNNKEKVSQYTIMISRGSNPLNITLLTDSIVDTNNEVIVHDLSLPYEMFIPFVTDGYINESFMSDDLTHLNSSILLETTEEGVHIIDQPLYVGEKFYDIHSNKFEGAEGGEVSISFWFKIDEERPQILFAIPNDKDTYENINNYDFYISIDDMGFVHIHTGYYDDCDVSSFIPVADVWNHIGFTYFSDIKEGTNKKYFINGQIFSCEHKDVYYPVLGSAYQLGSGGITISDFTVYKTAVADNIWKAKFNEQNDKPFIYLKSLTSSNNYKVTCTFTFSTDITLENVNKYKLLPEGHTKDFTVEWNTSNNKQYTATITFPTRSYNVDECPSVILMIQNGFIRDANDKKKKNDMEKFIINYDCTKAPILEPAATNPVISSVSPAVGNIEDDQIITLTWDQDVICNDDIKIYYRQSDSFNGELLSTDFTVYKNYISILPPYGLLHNRNIYFIIPAGSCTDLSGTKTSELYTNPEDKWTIPHATTPYTGSLTCDGENNQKISSFLITCTLSFNRNVTFIDYVNKIHIVGGEMSIPQPYDNYILFYVYPTFTKPSSITDNNYVDISYTITVDESIAKDLARIPTYSSSLEVTINSQYNPILRYYKYNQNGNNYESNNKDCIIPNAGNDAWGKNFDDEKKAFLHNEERGSFYCSNTNDISFLAPVSNSFLTIQFWYFTSTNDITITFIEKYFSNNVLDYKIALSNGAIIIQTASEGNAGLTTNAPTPGYWHQITLVMQSISANSKIDLYIDGVFALTGEVLLSKSYYNLGSDALYIGSNNEFSMSETIFYAYLLEETTIKNNFEKYARPIISIENFQMSECGPFTFDVVSNKKTHGLVENDFIVNPKDSIKFEIQTTSSGTIYNIVAVPISEGQVSIRIAENALLSDYNKGSLTSDEIVIRTSFCINRDPKLIWTSPEPCVRNYNQFIIDFSNNDYPLDYDMFTSNSLGSIQALSVSGRKVIGYYVLNALTDLGVKGYVYYKNNVCGENKNEECSWSLTFAYQFTGIYAPYYEQDTLRTFHYNQLRFEYAIMNEIVLSAEVGCGEMVAIGFRQISKKQGIINRGYSCAFQSVANNGIVCYNLNKYANNTISTLYFTPVSPKHDVCNEDETVTIWLKIGGNKIFAGRGNYEDENSYSFSISGDSSSTNVLPYVFIYHTINDHNPFFLENIKIQPSIVVPGDDGSDNTFTPVNDCIEYQPGMDISNKNFNCHIDDDDDDENSEYQKKCLKTSLTMDTSDSNNIKGTLMFDNYLSAYHNISYRSFICNNCYAYNVQLITGSNCHNHHAMYTFDVHVINKKLDFTVSLPIKKACEDRHHEYDRRCNCRVTYTGNLHSEQVDQITAELTWNELTNTNSLPIYVTLTFNRQYEAKLEDFIIEKGGKILHVEPTSTGGIISVIPEDTEGTPLVEHLRNHFICRVKSHIIEEGELYSPEASIDIITSVPTGVNMEYVGVTDTIYSEAWKGLEHGFIGFMFTLSGYGNLNIDLSPAPHTIPGIYRLHLDNNIDGVYELQRRTSIKNWETITSFTDKKVNGKENQYKITFVDSILTLSVLQGINYPIDTTLFTYNCGTFKPLYYGFSTDVQSLILTDINNLYVDNGDYEWKDLSISISQYSSIQDLPIYITVNSDIVVPLEKWILFNGYMSVGKNINEFYFYPNSYDGQSSFYLDSRIPNEQNILTKTSSVFVVYLGSKISSIYLPKLYTQDNTPIYNELMKFDEINTLELPVTVKTETNNKLNMILYSSLTSKNYNYFEISLCGRPSISYYEHKKNKQSSQAPASMSIDCTQESSGRIQVTEDNGKISVTYYYNSANWVFLEVSSIFTLSYYTFQLSDSFASVQMARPFTDTYCIENQNIYSDFVTSDTMSQDECKEYCGPYHAYFGLLNGNKCICYPNIAYIYGSRVNNDKCSKSCIGDNSQKCGGSSYLTIIPTRYVSYFSNQYSYNRLLTKVDSLTYEYGVSYDELSIKMTDTTKNTIYNSPLYVMDAPKEYTVSTRFYIPVSGPTESVGFVVYDDDRNTIITMCTIEINKTKGWSIISNSPNNNNGNGVLLNGAAHEWNSINGWLRLSRDNEGIYKCSYRLEDPLWSEPIIDNTHTEVIGKKLGLYSVLQYNQIISFTEFTFTSDYERAYVYASHNLAYEQFSKDHYIYLTFSENFQIYKDTKFNMKNCLVKDVVPLSHSSYIVYLTTPYPGSFSFSIPKDVSGDLSEQGNYPLSYGCDTSCSDSIDGSYNPEFITVLLTNKGMKYIDAYGMYANLVYVTFDKEVVDFDVTKLIMKKLEHIDSYVVDKFNVALYVRFIQVSSGSIVLPANSVYTKDKITNKQSNTLILTVGVYCKGYTSYENDVKTLYDDTLPGSEQYRPCSSEYEGYVSKRCNIFGQWESEDLSGCQKKKCNSVTENGYTWPITEIDQDAELNCPFGYTGSITRYCRYTCSKPVWGEIISTCEKSDIINENAYKKVVDRISNEIEVPLEIIGTIQTVDVPLPNNLSFTVKNDGIHISGKYLNTTPYTGKHVLKITNGNVVTTYTLEIILTDFCVYDGETYGKDSIITVPCGEGYTGTRTMKCTVCDSCDSLDWMVTSNTCQVLQCSQNIDEIYSLTWPSTMVGSSVILDCPYGQEGSVTRTCQTGQIWSDITYDCQIPQCSSNIDSIYNINWPATNVLTTATSPCPTGLSGSITRFCNTNKQWGPVVNTCTVPQCSAEVDNQYEISWPNTEIGESISMTCPEGQQGSLTRVCLEGSIWSGITSTCHTEILECPEFTYSIYDYIFVFEATNAGSTASVVCGSGHLSIECDSEGNWKYPVINNCGSCKAGEYEKPIDDSDKHICVECTEGHYCNGGEDQPQCPENQYAPAGSSECLSCPNGHILTNKNGNYDCLVCEVGQKFINGHCENTKICLGDTTADGTYWRPVNVGEEISAPCVGDNVRGEMFRKCIDESNEDINGVWDKVNTDNCLPKVPPEGEKFVVFYLQYHKVPQSIYNQDEAEYDNVRALVQTFAFSLSFLHTIDVGQDIHETIDNGITDTHPYTKFNLTISVQQSFDAPSFLRGNLNYLVKYTRRLDELTYHYDYYIMIEGEADIYQYYTYCYNEEYNKKVAVGDYLYTPCEHLEENSIATMVGEVATLCDYDYDLHMTIWRESKYKGCKPIYPIQNNHVFIDMFYIVKYTVASNYYCGAVRNFFHKYIHYVNNVIYDYDIYSFKNITIDGAVATQFTCRFETHADKVTQVKNKLQNISDLLYELVYQAIPNVLSPSVDIVIPTDDVINITYYQDNQNKKRVRL
ncbi:hypothetical protein WA158_006548 [Blastocystis sp. Blastoise]